MQYRSGSKRFAVRECGRGGLAGLLNAVALGAALLPGMCGAAPAAPTAGPAGHETDAARAVLSAMPLSFEPNVGQAPAGVDYLAHSQSYAIGLSARGAILSQAAATGAHGKSEAGGDEIRMDLVGGSEGAAARGESRGTGVVNYYVGNDPAHWKTGVPVFGKVRYSGVYRGVDLVYYGNQQHLEYDFVVVPGASAKPIELELSGAAARIDARGNLNLRSDHRALSFDRPVAYQIVGEERHPVKVSYRVQGKHVRFALGEYDHSRALVIDPVLTYFSYLGGSGYDVIGTTSPQASQTSGQGAAVDSAGELYVAGYTQSTNFPTQAAYQASGPTKVGGNTWGFVTKFAANGQSLVFSTYLGGTLGSDYAYGIAVDTSGNAFVVGYTGSNDFPVTSGAYQTICSPNYNNNQQTAQSNCSGTNGVNSAFVSKLSATGALSASTFLSGTITQSEGVAVAVDAAGRPYVAGYTFPGENTPAGIPYYTQTVGFPTTAGAVQTAYNYSATLPINGALQYDAFVSVFDPALSTLIYSTMIGDDRPFSAISGVGSQANTIGEAVTVDSSGNFYLAGYTQDTYLPTTAGSFEPNPLTCGHEDAETTIFGGNCGFVSKFSPVGSAGGPSLIYATYLGGQATAAAAGGSSWSDYVTGIAADSSGDAYVVGYANEAGFPTTVGAYQPTCNGYVNATNTGDFDCSAVFIAKLNPTGTSLLAGTYFGCVTCNGDDVFTAGAIALDASNNVYIAGFGLNGLPLVNGFASNNTIGGAAPFVAEFDPTLATLKFSTFINVGNAGQIAPAGMVLDSLANIYVAGNLNSPVGSAATSGAFQSAYGGGDSDGFVAKITVFAQTATAVTASPSTTTTGSPVSLTATVAQVSGTGVPTGTVTFDDGATPIGSGTLNGSGVANFVTSALGAGTHSITAVYGGDGNDATSTSAAVTVTIKIAVPNVVGLTQSAAGTAITGAGLTVGTVTTQSSSTAPSGTVISQSPAGGASVAGGSAVSLVVSSGPAKDTVPNVVGLTQSAAGTAITGAGLTVGTVTTQSSSTVPSGSVISQSPVAGTSVAGGSAVSLVVSSGPAAATVPNVVNLTQAAASSAISAAGLTVGTVTTATSYTVAAGNVASESPSAGTSVVAGSAVNLVIARNLPICDVNGDGQVDSRDIALIDAVLNTPAAGPYDPRDSDRNGVINILDARKCVTLCTHAGCTIN
jgi:beta-lactam-binding protein with PASTA domain